MKRRVSMASVSFIVLGLALIGQSSAKIDPETIVGMWLFDEGAGNIAKDVSENGNDGELREGPRWSAGKFGKALEFDNKSTYVDCGNDKGLDVNSFTLAAWVFPTDIDEATHEMIVGKGWSATERSYYLSIFQGKAFVSFRNPGNTAQADVQGNTLLNESTWYRIAGTHDRAAKKVTTYLNGVKENEKVFNHDVMITPKTVLVGNLGDNTLFFGGKLDEVAIFNVALSEADIKSIMEGLQSIIAVSPSGNLVTVWGAIKAQ